MFRLVLKIHYR